MIGLVTDGPFDVVLGSRILGGRALAGGMPLYKYVANRAADRGAEPAVRREALRVPHRLPRLHARGARDAAAARELRRLRVRQPDARADPAGGLRDRRGELPGRLLRGGVVDQLPALGALRARRAVRPRCRRSRSARASRRVRIFDPNGRRLDPSAPPSGASLAADRARSRTAELDEPVEAAPGFEPAMRVLQTLCLTTWLRARRRPRKREDA